MYQYKGANIEDEALVDPQFISTVPSAAFINTVNFMEFYKAQHLFLNFF